MFEKIKRFFRKGIKVDIGIYEITDKDEVIIEIPGANPMEMHNFVKYYRNEMKKTENKIIFVNKDINIKIIRRKNGRNKRNNKNI